MTKATAIVIGHTGGIGAAVYDALGSSNGYGRVIGLGRGSVPALDILDEASIELVADWVKQQDVEIRLIFDATGALALCGRKPEKSLRDLDAQTLADSFALNAVGPALLMKHFLPLLPKDRRAVFATLSARVGSIGDNRLGGWYAYRAAKAALNQLVHTAAVELARKNPQAICVALHPGTVRTQLTEAFAKTGLEVQEPQLAADRLLAVVDGLSVSDTGGFFDHHGKPVPW